MRSIPRSNGLRASDAEITRPQSDGPFDAPEQNPSWHVHLELHPDELVTLHRMGFTGGALAWREGMHDWQPLRLGDPPPLAPPQKPSDRPPASEVPMALVRRRQKSSDSDSSPESSAFNERRSASGPISHTDELGPRLKAFSRRARTIPPIAMPMAVPVIDVPPRPTLSLLPPPPPVERPAPPEAWDTAAHVSSYPSIPALSDSAVREIQQVPSIPPLEVPNRPLRGVGSRALWLGAAALVALSASNGALVSALLWSLRHSASASVAALSRSFNANMCPAPTATGPSGTSAKPIAASTATPVAAAAAAAPALTTATPSHGLEKHDGPVSIEELPLVSEPTSSHASRSRASEKSSASRSSASSRAAAAQPSHGKAARLSLAEEVAAAAHRSSPAPAAPSSNSASTDNGPNRENMAKALALASASASTCSDGPERGRVAVTFSPSGSVQGVRLVQSFGEAGVNSCVLRAMGRAHVTPFSGDAVTVTKTLSW